MGETRIVFDHDAVRLYQGHALDVLRSLPENSVHCIVTSPPYWGLRSYDTEPVIWGGDAVCEHVWGVSAARMALDNRPSGKSALLTNAGRGPKAGDKYSSQVGRRDTGRRFFPGRTGSYKDGGPSKTSVFAGAFCRRCGAWTGHLGLEPTPEMYTEHLVMIFRECHRILRKDGSLWIVIGSSYASGDRMGFRPGNPEMNRGVSNSNGAPRPPGLKSKDLVGIPWMLAFALRADGWWLRSETIWEKKNPMPESVTDRPTRSHEQVFLLTKSPTYFYDHEAIREPHTSGGLRKDLGGPDGFVDLGMRGGRAGNPESGRNKRSVWSLPSEPYGGAHFAVFPRALVRTCLLAGTSQKGVCPTCGAPWIRVVEKTRAFVSGSGKAGHLPVGKHGPDLQGGGETKDIRRGPIVHSVTTGWRPECSCRSDGLTIPAVVLDPFAGTATTLVVARSLGRHGIGIELSDAYCEQALKRLGEPYQEEDGSLIQTRLALRQPSVFDP